jgi:hypothetical protein
MPFQFPSSSSQIADGSLAVVLSGSRQAAGSLGGVAFDGLTSSTRATAALSGSVGAPTTYTIGTEDFTAWVRFRCPASVTAERGIIGLGPNATDAGGSGSFRVILQTSGTLSVRLGTVPETLDFSGFVAAYGGEVVDVVVTRGSAGWAVYINGTAATASSGSLTTGATVTSTYLHLAVGLTSTNIFNDRIYRAVVFNRALSASDVGNLVVVGVDPADQWANPTNLVDFTTPINNGGFETNLLNAAGTWATHPLGSSTATIDTSGTFSRTGTNAAKLTIDGSSSNVGISASNNSTTLLRIGKRHRVSAWARRGASVTAAGIRFREGGGGAIVLSTGNVLTTTYQNYTLEWVMGSTNAFRIERDTLTAANAEIYIDDVTIQRIGAVVDLDFTMGCGNQLQDGSSNNFHANLFGGFSWLNVRDFGQLRVNLLNSGNTQFPVGLPADALIQSIAANAAGAVTLSIGTASGGTQVVNAASLSTGRNGPLTVASAFPGGTLWGNLSAAVQTQVTINFAICQ